MWCVGWRLESCLALYVMHRVCTFPSRPVVSTNGCAYKTLDTGKMTRMLLLSLFLLFVHVCACAHVCMRACVRFVSLFFLLPVRNVKCWFFFVLFVFEAVFSNNFGWLWASDPPVLLSECWDYRCSLCQVSVMLRSKPRALCILGKSSTSWAIVSTPVCVFANLYVGIHLYNI